MITTPNINGSPKDKPQDLSKILHIHSDDNFFYFAETPEDVTTIEAMLPPPENPQPEPTLSPALQAVIQSSPEDLQQIANLLKNYL